MKQISKVNEFQILIALVLFIFSVLVLRGYLKDTTNRKSSNSIFTRLKHLLSIANIAGKNYQKPSNPGVKNISGSKEISEKAEYHKKKVSHSEVVYNPKKKSKLSSSQEKKKQDSSNNKNKIAQQTYLGPEFMPHHNEKQRQAIDGEQINAALTKQKIRNPFVLKILCKPKQKKYRIDFLVSCIEQLNYRFTEKGVFICEKNKEALLYYVANALEPGNFLPKSNDKLNYSPGIIFIANLPTAKAKSVDVVKIMVEDAKKLAKLINANIYCERDKKTQLLNKKEYEKMLSRAKNLPVP